MSSRLPVVTGDRLVRVLLRLGWRVNRQRGSHVRLKRGNVSVSIAVHAKHTLPSGTLAAILGEVWT